MAPNTFRDLTINAERQKHRTVSKRLHRFQPFSERINKIRVKSVQRQDFLLETPGNTDQSSCFQAGLERAQDLNSSENFTVFARQCSPLCDSLAQVLHHQDEIGNLLFQYVSKEDDHSLEHLLELVSYFAQDLRSRFEKHYALFIGKVLNIAAKHQDPSVIEWCFDCVARIFKHLFRLLVPDLRPTLKLFLPYLGKEQQSRYIAVFSAEALSFLVRKAALSKESEALGRTIDYSLDSILHQEPKDGFSLLDIGTMSLFSESCKGPGHTLHRCSGVILESLIDRAAHHPGASKIFCGVVTNLTHHTTIETFQPVHGLISSYIVSKLEETSLQPGTGILLYIAELLFVMIAVRKASRVDGLKWPALLRLVCRLTHHAGQSELTMESHMALLRINCAALLFCPSIFLIGSDFRSFSQEMLSDSPSNLFPMSCVFLCDMEPDKFKTALSPLLNRFVTDYWRRKQDVCAVLMFRLYKEGLFQENQVSAGCHSKLSAEVQQTIAAEFRQISQTVEVDGWSHVNMRKIAYAEAFLVMLKTFAVDETIQDDIDASLLTLAMKALEPTSSEESVSAIGRGSALLRCLSTDCKRKLPRDIWSRVSLSGPGCFREKKFLLAICQIAKSVSKDSFPSEDLDSLLAHLYANMRDACEDLRNRSLDIAIEIYLKMYETPSDLLETTLRVSRSSLDFDNIRTVSLMLRSIAANFSLQATSDLVQNIVINFLLGFKTVKLAKLAEDTVEALKVIGYSNTGGLILSTIVLEQLQDGSPTDVPPVTALEPSTQQELSSAFECSTLAATSAEAAKAFDFFNKNSPHVYLEQQFEGPVPKTYPFVRADALDILIKLPGLAEKKSRIFVPLFLGKHDAWTYWEVKKALKVMAQFENPKTLFKSPEVYQVLLGWLANGDSEVQKDALRSVFAWKDKAIVAYKENLFRLLDEAHFRDEITLFVHQDESSISIQPDHRNRLLPILLRLLFGRLISKTGAGKTGDGQRIRRSSIIRALVGFELHEIKTFIDIAYASITISEVDQHKMLKRTAGFLNILLDLLQNSGQKVTQLETHVTPLVLQILSQVQASANDDSEDQIHIQSSQFQPLQGTKVIRRDALKCLDLLFSKCRDKDWSLELPQIYDYVVGSPTSHYRSLNAHSISTSLRILHTWSSDGRSVLHLADPRGQIFRTLLLLLKIPDGHVEVKQMVLDIVDNVCKFSSSDESHEIDEAKKSKIEEALIQPNLNDMIISISEILRGSPSVELLSVTVHTLQSVSNFVNSAESIGNLLKICSLLLVTRRGKKSAIRVSPKTKSQILGIVDKLSDFIDLKKDDTLFETVVESAASLFSFFTDLPNRASLSGVFEKITRSDPRLLICSKICADLNSQSAKVLDQLDFDRCLSAFNDVNTALWSSFGVREWTPVVYCAVYHLKNRDELAIRSSASLTLQRFIDRVSSEQADSSRGNLGFMVPSTLLSAFREGVLDQSEFVRAEVLSVLAHAVKKLPKHSNFSSMQSLLVHDDLEASFFTNILHIQQHRRLRALRRLSSQAQEQDFDLFMVRRILIPLVEHFILSANGAPFDPNLTFESVQTIGSLAASLDWRQFQALFRSYISLLKERTDDRRSIVKLIDALAKTLRQATLDTGSILAETMIIDGTAEANGSNLARSRLSRTLPASSEGLVSALDPLLYNLMEYLHDKDDASISLRIPLALSVVKLLTALPAGEGDSKIASVLTDVCHILRSRSQDSRNLTRKTLVEIAQLIGPLKFNFILNELRGALIRGYQLHVLSYTVHSLLVAVSTAFSGGQLDHCGDSIMAIIMDDIFGVTGQEKEAEGYVSQMIEIKKSMSYDSLQIMAKITTVSHIPTLLRPIQSLLEEKLNLSTLNKIDALLDRLTKGFEENQSLRDEKVLVLCYELVREAYRQSTAITTESQGPNLKNKRYLVALKRSNEASSNATNFYSFKMIKFALDIFRAALKRNETLLKPMYIVNFLPVVGDAFLHSQKEVQLAAAQLLIFIISRNVDLKEIDRDGGVYLAQAVKYIKDASSTNSAISQASLKLITVVLQRRSDLSLKESWVVHLLKLIQPDLLQHNQKTSFDFIKVLIDREIVLAEMYDVADTVASIMVTSHSDATRKHAREVYVASLLKLSQKKERVSKQLAFLIKNLEYAHPEGRLSVLETIHRLLKDVRRHDDTKADFQSFQDIGSFFFIPLAMMIVNDEAQECRESASVLLSQVFKQASLEDISTFKASMKQWTDRSDQLLLMRAGIQSYLIYVETQDHVEADVSRHLKLLLERTLEVDDKQANDAWDIVYHALRLLKALCGKAPDLFLSKSCASIWESTLSLLRYPHLWVKATAASLVEIAFNDLARHNQGQALAQIPLVGTHGFSLESKYMQDVTTASFRILSSQDITTEVATQASRNLLFLGRCFSINGFRWETQQEADADVENVESDEEDDKIAAKISTISNKTALTYILQKLSQTLRREPKSVRAPALISKTVSLQLLATLCHHMPLEVLQSNVALILLPLYHFTDSSIAAPHSSDKDFKDAYDNLIATSHELMSLIQKKLGSSEYVAELVKIREAVKEKREARKVKRRIDVVADPQKAGREKQRKGERKRERRKEKGMEYRGTRRGW